MEIAEVIGFVDRLKLVQGIEGDLRKRHRLGTFAGLAAMVFQVVVAVSQKDYLSKLGRFFGNLVTGHWSELFGGERGLNVYGLTGALVLIAGTTGWFLFRRTRFLLQDSAEPFRYTFSVDPFMRVSVAQTDADAGREALSLQPVGRFRLLHHDLMDKLSSNIGRLSLLNPASLKDADKRDLSSHIQISGHYLVSDPLLSNRTIEIMPRIRIGPADQPEQLAPRIVLNDTEFENGDLSAVGYAQIVEHVYSRIATAVYQQIRHDIRTKISLYPTQYVRAVGLFYEAKDFEQSNTVDAYDHAIDLYREALRYFDVRRMRTLCLWLLWTPLLWRLVRRSQLLEARARIAYCRCLVYRRIVSALSGRTQNGLFEVPNQLKQALAALERLYACASQRRSLDGQLAGDDDNLSFGLISRYLTYPRDKRASRLRPIFDEQRLGLFEAYAVAALAYSQLGAFETARTQLRLARATAPDTADRSPIYLLAVAEAQPDLTEKLHLLINAREIAPTFEIVCYRLAHYSNMRFRLRNELSLERATPIINAFEAVERINPGNIGAYAANGYLWWLLEDHTKADCEYRDGLNVKAIRQQTFVGDLSYGRARIAAEAGRFDEAFDLYVQAVAADPGVGAYTATETRLLNEYYEYMNDSMLARYKRFVKHVREKAARMRCTSGNMSERTRDAVVAFALNDFANGCFQYYMRTGQPRYLDRAIKHYEEAVKLNPESAVSYYNLSSALAWTQTRRSDSLENLEKAEKLAPNWFALLVQSVESNLGGVSSSIRELTAETERLTREITELETQKMSVGQEPAELSSQQMPQQSVQGLIADAPVEVLQRKRLESDIRNTRKRIDEDIKAKRTRIAEIRQKLMDARRTHRRTQIIPRLKRILQVSNFASFFEGPDPDDLVHLVRRFLDTPLRQDQVDEDFVELLRVWARLVAQETDQKEVLAQGQDLCNYIHKQFYPEHFLVHLTLLELYRRLNSSPRQRRGRIESVWAVRSAIDDSLQSDPTRWSYLNWALEYFEMELFALKAYLWSALDQAGSASGPIGQWGLIGEDLKSQFRESGFELPRGAMLSTVKPGDEWMIRIDGGAMTYRLISREHEDKISVVFAGRGHIEVLKAAVERSLDDVRDKKKLAVLNSMLADRYVSAGEDDLAVDQYGRAVANDDRNSGYLNSLGNYHYQKQRYREAATAYDHATKLEPQNDLFFSYLALAEEAQTSFTEKDSGEHWHRAVEALKRATVLKPDTVEYAKRLQNATEQLGLHDYFGGAPLLPVVTPIGVEVGSAAFLEVTDSETERVTAMRSAIEKETGVRVPVIRWRADEDSSNNYSYRIFLGEVVATAGAVDPNQPDPMEQILKDLDQFIRHHLPEFMGHQEVLNTLELSSPDLFKHYESHFDDLSELVSVCGALLREGVRVARLANIANSIKDSPGVPLQQRLPELRLSAAERRELLPPGYDGETVLLGNALLDWTARPGVHVADGVLRIDSPARRALLTTIEDLIRNKKRPVIVAEDEALRPYLRWVIEDSLAAVPVLSRREASCSDVADPAVQGAFAHV